MLQQKHSILNINRNESPLEVLEQMILNRNSANTIKNRIRNQKNLRRSKIRQNGKYLN